MKSRSHLLMEATFKRAECCERWISCRWAIALIAVHFKPKARIRIGLEPAPGRVSAPIT
jgi:hypothetical protein